MVTNLFMVWYLGAQIILTSGPLNYSMKECEEKARDQLEYVKSQDDKYKTFEGLSIQCERLDVRPLKIR